MSSTFTTVKTLLIQILGVKESDVTPDTAISDLGGHSLDNVQLLMAFEEEFGIQIPNDKAEKIETVGDVVTYIDAYPR